MKKTLVAITIAGIVLSAGCKIPRPDTTRRTTAATRTDTTTQSASTPEPILINDSLFALISRLQDSLTLQPGDRDLMRRLCTIAYDTVSYSYITVGKGYAQPGAAQRPARLRAAEQSARRWGLYLKAWRSGMWPDFGQPIAGTIGYSQPLLELIKGDTLLILTQIPGGSIELDHPGSAL